MANPRTIAKLESRIHERISYCLDFEVSDPRAGMITLTSVKLTPDLSIADVRYTVLGGKSERTKAEHMLESAKGFIQRQMSRVLSMRRTPALRFHYDESLLEAQRLDRLIADALERDRLIQAQGTAPESDEPESDEPESDEPEVGDESDEPGESGEGVAESR